MSLAEIKSALDARSLEELAEIVTFVRKRDQAVWDRQIDEDFAEDGRLSSIAEGVCAEIDAGRLQNRCLNH